MGQIKVERDPLPDADDHGGWRVIEAHRGIVPPVLFRGDIAECTDYARGVADDQRWRASNCD